MKKLLFYTPKELMTRISVVYPLYSLSFFEAEVINLIIHIINLTFKDTQWAKIRQSSWCVLTCFCSFTYLETIQKWVYFGLLFHLKLILSHSIVLQKCAFKFSFSCLGYAGSITSPCFSVLVRAPAECKQISRHLADKCL